MKKHVGLCCWIDLNDKELMNEAMCESAELWVGPLAGISLVTLGMPPWGTVGDKYTRRDFSFGTARMIDVSVETDGWPDGPLPPFIAWALAYDPTVPKRDRVRLTEFRRQYESEGNEIQGVT